MLDGPSKHRVLNFHILQLLTFLGAHLQAILGALLHLSTVVNKHLFLIAWQLKLQNGFELKALRAHACIFCFDSSYSLISMLLAVSCQLSTARAYAHSPFDSILPDSCTASVDDCDAGQIRWHQMHMHMHLPCKYVGNEFACCPLQYMCLQHQDCVQCHSGLLTTAFVPAALQHLISRMA